MFFIIKKTIKYAYLKCKWREKLRFNWSVNIGLRSSFEGMNQIHSHSKFHGDLGYGSYIGPNCCLNGKIGRFTSIAPFVRCNEGKHPLTYPYVSTAPCFYSLNLTHSQNGSTYATAQLFDEVSHADVDNKFGVIVGNDCWIGEGVFLVGGIRIADGAVILAHAVVTKDVPAYAIVGGVPAKIIGYRYSNEDIEFLLHTRWWENSPLWVKEHWELFSNFNKFKKYYEDSELDNKKEP